MVIFYQSTRVRGKDSYSGLKIDHNYPLVPYTAIDFNYSLSIYQDENQNQSLFLCVLKQTCDKQTNNSM